MGDRTFVVPAAAWKHNFDEPLDQVKKHSQGASLGGIIRMLPMILRLMRYIRRHKGMSFDPINASTRGSVEPYNGVPLGGIGSGSIGRGWRGDFRRWQIRPGRVNPVTVWADQFSLFVERDGQKTTQVLFPGRPDDGALNAWNWDLPAKGCGYAALFPRAWTRYTQPAPGIRLTSRQFSPIIANNYRESSYPVCEFRWKIENTGADEATVGLMFTFQNGIGSPNDREGGHSNAAIHQYGDFGAMTGVSLRYAYRQQEIAEGKSEDQLKTFEDPLTFAIGGKAGYGGDVSYRTRFVTSGDGADVWMDFCDDGRLDNNEDDRPSKAGETIGAALAVTVRVPAGESREISFTLAWDMPRVRFGAGATYYRQYTRYYGTYGTVAPKMAYDALFFADEWEEKVERWQVRLLQQTGLLPQARQPQQARMPQWYRGALFNELYYLVDGGTIWCYPTQGTCPDREVGHFAYLESLEYPMYNTYDVHFYASFALIQLWPKLELALQRDMAAATLAEYPDTFTEIFSGKRGRRKLYGSVPHDIGWPDEDPWNKVNGYPFHDVNQWKDLNPKFVLQIYRDYLVTGDKQFLRDTWEAVEAAIRRANRFDRDGDGLIENDGQPDQTYDVWAVKGPSAYTGGLWLACLSAGAELAKAVGEKELEVEYRRMLAKGKYFYEKKLWNGHYYNYDSSTSPQHDSIMADQLAGQWYARACGLLPIVDPQHAKSALSTIYKLNVMHFNDGQMGAVNGMRPNGMPDTTSMQAQEVWSGTTYALAAAMIQEDLCDEGYATAQGVYKMTYEKTGYWFQTPEAWDALGNARAICYMRPLAIWAMQWAIDKRWERAR